MSDIHYRVIAAAKRARAINSYNLCISFKISSAQDKYKKGEYENHTQRVNCWLFESGAYRAIRAFKEWEASDLPPPALNYRAYEIGRENLYDLANSDDYYGTKHCYFCVFDTIEFCKNHELELEPWNLAQAQFAAIAWPEEAEKVGISPPSKDFIFALWKPWESSFLSDEENIIDNDDYWDSEIYHNLIDHFCEEINKRNQFSNDPSLGRNFGKTESEPNKLHYSEKELTQINLSDDKTGALESEREFLLKQLEVVQNERDQLQKLITQYSIQELAPTTEDHQEIQASSELRITQIRFMIATAKALGYDPLSIPDGGKQAIKNACLALPALFTEASFGHAWKAAGEYLRMANHESFAKR
ncbi:hypothetical protein ABH313_13410 [Chromobacterium vaccinii]|uniref:hypothetical protein n=1 Tax=Chromobacterium vaccinii TaxID=1108595 RepID=UPI00326008A6